MRSLFSGTHPSVSNETPVDPKPDHADTAPDVHLAPAESSPHEDRFHRFIIVPSKEITFTRTDPFPACPSIVLLLLFILLLLLGRWGDLEVLPVTTPIKFLPISMHDLDLVQFQKKKKEGERTKRGSR